MIKSEIFSDFWRKYEISDRLTTMQLETILLLIRAGLWVRINIPIRDRQPKIRNTFSGFQHLLILMF